MNKIFLRQRLACLTVLLLTVLPFASAQARGNPDAVPGGPLEPIYEIIVDYDVEIPMRDGTILRADVYRPDAEGQFPTLLEGTPYGKATATEIRQGTHTLMVPMGYVLVARDLRGMYDSEGEMFLHEGDQDDSYDSIEWIINQPWSDGQVASLGGSYPGQVAMHAAISGHPNLVCAIPNVTAADVWRQWFYRGGALEFGFLSSWVNGFSGQYAVKHLDEAALTEWTDLRALFNADRDAFSRVMPLTAFEPGQVGPNYNLWKEWLEHPQDSLYWRAKSPDTYYKNINIPILHIGGWYDIFSAGTLQAYQDISMHGATAQARENQRVIMNPFPHMSPMAGTDTPGYIFYPPNVGGYDREWERVAFLDYWLKDLQHPGFDPDLPVRYYTMGEEKWVNTDTWPPADTQYTNFYFNNQASGSIASLNDGGLSAQAPATESSALTYVYDPMDPLPSRGGSMLFSYDWSAEGSVLSGGMDQGPVELKSLTFTSDLLAQDLEITGRVRAVLYAASSAVDTDWIVRVTDVSPEGWSNTVVEGIQRARFRESGMYPTLITPGEIYEYEVDLWNTSHVFKQGHRIRVTVNSSSFPRWSRNMNVAEFPEQAAEWEIANNTIYLDAAHPSHVILPVIPR